MLLEGIFLPLTTPFHPDGRIFLRKLETNVERYSRTAASGMLVLGREGEGDALTDAETLEVLKAAIGAAADEKVMIANVGRESVSATMELVEFAAEAGIRCGRDSGAGVGVSDPADGLQRLAVFCCGQWRIVRRCQCRNGSRRISNGVPLRERWASWRGHPKVIIGAILTEPLEEGHERGRKPLEKLRTDRRDLRRQ